MGINGLCSFEALGESGCLSERPDVQKSFASLLLHVDDKQLRDCNFVLEHAKLAQTWTTLAWLTSKRTCTLQHK